MKLMMGIGGLCELTYGLYPTVFIMSASGGGTSAHEWTIGA